MRIRPLVITFTCVIGVMIAMAKLPVLIQGDAVSFSEQEIINTVVLAAVATALLFTLRGRIAEFKRNFMQSKNGK